MAENGGGGALKEALGWKAEVVELLLICHFGSIIAYLQLFVKVELSSGCGYV